MSSSVHASWALPLSPQTRSQPLSWFAVLFQKLSIADCPLYLRLLAGPDTEVLSFVLKENETGEVEVGPAPFAGAQMQPRGAAGGCRWAASTLLSIGGAQWQQRWQQENAVKKSSRGEHWATVL